MNSTELLNLLDGIAATPGKKDKQALVATIPETARAWVVAALDPTRPTYIAKLELPDKVGTKQLGIDEAQLLHKLWNRELTGNAALNAVQDALALLNRESQLLLQRVILKDLRAGIGAGTFNKAFPGSVPEFAYMRCSLPKDAKLAEWPWERGVYSQIKADGMFDRIRIDHAGFVQSTSRQGLTFPVGSLQGLERQALDMFGNNVELHGELTVWANGKWLHRKDGNGMLNSLQDGGELPEGHEVHYDVWDMVPADEAVPGGRVTTPYWVRFTNLIDAIKGSEGLVDGRIHLIEYKIVHSYAEAALHFREVLKRGLEGTVVKHPDMEWFDGDSKHQVKFKLEFEVELRIKGFNPGEVGKRTEHTFGSLLCETACGQLEVGVSGLKRDMELWLHENRDTALGMVIGVKANDIVLPSDSSPLHSLSHPRFAELRRDKKVADDLPRVFDQHQAAVEGRAQQ